MLTDGADLMYVCLDLECHEVCVVYSRHRGAVVVDFVIFLLMPFSCRSHIFLLRLAKLSPVVANRLNVLERTTKMKGTKYNNKKSNPLEK